MFKKKSTTTMPTELNMSFNIKKKKKNQATVLVEKKDVKFSNTRRRSSH